LSLAQRRLAAIKFTDTIGYALLGQRYESLSLALHDTDAFFAAMFRAVENHALNPLMLRYSASIEKAWQDPRYREVMTKDGLVPDLKE